VNRCLVSPRVPVRLDASVNNINEKKKSGTRLERYKLGKGGSTYRAGLPEPGCLIGKGSSKVYDFGGELVARLCFKKHIGSSLDRKRRALKRVCNRKIDHLDLSLGRRALFVSLSDYRLVSGA